MSGTSLDGLDLCLTRFWPNEEQWKFEIVEAKTIEYSKEWIESLRNAPNLSAIDLHVLDREFGRLLGELCKSFLESKGQKADLIASHGHTVFHQPERNLSVQIGHGAFIAAASGIDVISDFRSTDTAYGGEGAPLVPMAEKYLFQEHKAFLNVGGIANTSVHKEDGQILGFDICPANQVLNYISKKHFNLEYDKSGKLAKEGKVISDLLEKLNQIDFYSKKPPKSLGREFVEKEVLPLIEVYDNGKDLLRTFNEHMAQQISQSIRDQNIEEPIFLSGGGVYNQTLIDLLDVEGVELFKANDRMIDFKEALCFSLLGLLRIKGIPNCLSSVTGASKDSIGGSHYLA